MYGLPESTTVDRKIPKKKFYENLNVSPSLKRSFVEEIQAINWSNKIAPSTVNIQEGNCVKELEVFTIELIGNTLNEAVLRQIDREIPYHILFVLQFEEKVQAWIAYKESSGNNQTAFRVEKYYHSDWQKDKDYRINLEGLNMDEFYENVVRHIAGESFEKLVYTQGESLQETVERESLAQQLESQIEKLQKRIRQEKQLNKQFEINGKIKKLKKELRALKNG